MNTARQTTAQSRTTTQNEKGYLRYFVGFSCVLFLVILVVCSVAFWLSMQQVIRDRKEVELTRLLEMKRTHLETSVNSKIAIVLQMAKSPLIVRYFSNPDDSELRDMALEEAFSYNQALSGMGFWVNDIDKKFYISTNETHSYIVDPERPENYWYNMTLYSTDTYNFNINYNPDLDVISLWINAPVFNREGKPIGIVGSGIDILAFIRMLYKENENKIALYFFNEEGEITGAMDIGKIIEKKHIETILGDTNGILSKATKLEPGETFSFDSPRGKVVIGTVPKLEWYSVAVMPDSIDDYKNYISVLFIVMLAVMALIIVIFNVFIAFFLKSLRKTMHSLETASRYKSEFLARMSHEIRTPMNAVIGMAELASREDVSTAAYEHIVMIKQSGQTLLSIINDILDFSKIEAGKLEIVPTEYLLSSLINDVVGIIQMRLDDSHVCFTVNIDSNIPNALLGDEIKIRQVLINMLSNAIKYTEEGYVILNVTGTISSNDENVINLVMEIQDSGKGIKPEDLRRLFEDFVQFDSDRNIEGTGLGLSIAKHFIKSMGGNVTVHSEYGKGSIFTVTLPQVVREHDKLAVIENPGEKRVLIYENRSVYADSIARSIDNLGVEYVFALTDPDLFEKLSSGKWSFMFIAFSLYKNVKELCSMFEAKVKFVIIADFGESLDNPNLTRLALPAHSISIANILNGTTDDFAYSLSYSSINWSVTRFIAPEAEILIVDDIGTNLHVMEGLLRPYNMHISLCSSGMESIDAITKKKYDVVFMDHMMPEMDGVEATSRIRALDINDPYFTSVPIIAMTANAVSSAKAMFLTSGFDDFLSKPIDTIKLNSILERWIPKEKQKRIVVPRTRKKRSSGKASDIMLDPQIAEVFVRDANKAISVLDDLMKNPGALTEEDTRQYIVYTHGIKNALANIGKKELSAIAFKLEAAGREGRFEVISTETFSFINSLSALVQELTPEEKTGDIADEDKHYLIERLLAIQSACENYDEKTADKTLTELRAKTWSQQTEELLAMIAEQLLCSEFEKVVDAVKQFVDASSTTGA